MPSLHPDKVVSVERVLNRKRKAKKRKPSGPGLVENMAIRIYTDSAKRDRTRGREYKPRTRDRNYKPRTNPGASKKKISSTKRQRAYKPASEVRYSREV